MTSFQYLVSTDSEPIAVTLTASGRIALSQDGASVYFPGASADTLIAAITAMHAPDAPLTNTPAKTGRMW
ncbi:hypothetical protein [Tsukamurella tyrosinosolvens]|uniref:hypothetical protein n=1 Tax=Tsukamurella tyrosinosolvens TaxID=57704 RepID=UPI00079826F3|nr:hypothetical protein [Tsukamurella tyrosinosolvens]KXP05384.1 hypothetical protein AXK59_07385 [Tsukamurella tyrosinosolvens]